MAGRRRYSWAVEAARLERERARAAHWEARRREVERREAERRAHQQHLISRQQQAEQLNEELVYRVHELNGVLKEALSPSGWALDFETLKVPLTLPSFDPQGADRPAPAPRLEDFLPKPPGFWRQLLPGAQERHRQAVERARRLFEVKQAEHVDNEAKQIAWLHDAQRRHQEECQRVRAEVEKQHSEVDELRAGYLANDRDAVIEVLLQVLEKEELPSGLPQQVRVTLDPTERLLVLERELPSVAVIPTIGSYRWYKTRDEIQEVKRPERAVKAMYTTLVANIALRTLHIAFSADATNAVDVAVLNCFVDVINPATGKPDKPWLLSVRVTKEDFLSLDLSNVQPVLCLKRLRVLMSRSPHELEPVEPILTFNMVDARFVQGQSILDQLDQRKNIATLSAYEFEALVRDLFENMGHDTKQTRPSRDGGVDCVAFDRRPILGGKVVIQAKRYRRVWG